MDEIKVELNDTFDIVETDKLTDKLSNVDEKVDDPKVGMVFDSTDQIMDFYKIYGKERGFGVAIRSFKKGPDGKLRYLVIACSHTGKQRFSDNNPIKLYPQSKIECKARCTVLLCSDGKWLLTTAVLDHNHQLSPSKSQFYRCHRALNSVVKKWLLLNDQSGIRLQKTFNSFVVEAGGHDHVPFLEKDCRNYINNYRCLQLGEGDATAMLNYFMKMHVDNSEFFYRMGLDEEARLRNVFWADARSRAAFKEFGDVVTFDTTYLVNKYDMPFAPFMGVNHHGQLTLLGCALISNEDTESFIWLFQSWVKCMRGCSPNAIVTDQDKAMKKAIEIVFPHIRHRWCLWHIMKKLPEKLRGYKQYESIKFCMQNVVYDSLSKEEFEAGWGRFIGKYALESNEWLLGLYEERHRWVPAFVKDIFWAGMLTTQRSESMHAFFDGYVTSKITLKQFVGQYENALAKKVENEKIEDFNSFKACIPCITHYEMEKQFQIAYTTAKFKEFQKELIGKIYCHLSSCKEYVGFIEYFVSEDVSYGETHRRASFNVWFNMDTNEVNCSCQLFQFRGTTCRHQIAVLIEREIYRVPDKYILKRWSKSVEKRHSKIHISYDSWSVKPEARRSDKMCNAFYEVVELASKSEDRCMRVMAQIQNMYSEQMEEDEVLGNDNVLISCGDGTGIPIENRTILDPIVVRQKGKPPCNRKKSKIEQVVKKKRRKK